MTTKEDDPVFLLMLASRQPELYRTLKTMLVPAWPAIEGLVTPTLLQLPFSQPGGQDIFEDKTSQFRAIVPATTPVWRPVDFKIYNDCSKFRMASNSCRAPKSSEVNKQCIEDSGITGQKSWILNESSSTKICCISTEQADHQESTIKPALCPAHSNDVISGTVDECSTMTDSQLWDHYVAISSSCHFKSSTRRSLLSHLEGPSFSSRCHPIFALELRNKQTSFKEELALYLKAPNQAAPASTDIAHAKQELATKSSGCLAAPNDSTKQAMKISSTSTAGEACQGERPHCGSSHSQHPSKLESVLSVSSYSKPTHVVTHAVTHSARPVAPPPTSKARAEERRERLAVRSLYLHDLMLEVAPCPYDPALLYVSTQVLEALQEGAVREGEQPSSYGHWCSAPSSLEEVLGMRGEEGSRASLHVDTDGTEVKSSGLYTRRSRRAAAISSVEIGQDLSSRLFHNSTSPRQLLPTLSSPGLQSPMATRQVTQSPKPRAASSVSTTYHVMLPGSVGTSSPLGSCLNRSVGTSSPLGSCLNRSAAASPGPAGSFGPHGTCLSRSPSNNFKYFQQERRVHPNLKPAVADLLLPDDALAAAEHVPSPSAAAAAIQAGSASTAQSDSSSQYLLHVARKVEGTQKPDMARLKQSEERRQHVGASDPTIPGSPVYHREEQSFSSSGKVLSRCLSRADSKDVLPPSHVKEPSTKEPSTKEPSVASSNFCYYNQKSRQPLSSTSSATQPFPFSMYRQQLATGQSSLQVSLHDVDAVPHIELLQSEAVYTSGSSQEQVTLLSSSEPWRPPTLHSLPLLGSGNASKGSGINVVASNGQAGSSGGHSSSMILASIKASWKQRLALRYKPKDGIRNLPELRV
ncbi:hypothetical protein CEUSTIGMA_g4454.t1 [Chlamydomonas eustigma]|uniref:Uncharacterized protein n=1 Tax=Chlamydomonas eustigma TaxID=1157962 RepID=A0A250X1P7_9CHLO|nr:hypothetical protein CEUSTIGMA_g4454.t1 [Chlamydomonas eustigma]|eukprot:GAX77007.1 hypothetical protein CEUSTIGMA_g4454.t1 [Chlamydomonas eustigma]